MTEGSSVLEQLVAGSMAQKAAAQAKLTPVKNEAPLAAPVRTAEAPLAGRHEVSFPYDDPQTVLTALDVAEDEVHHILKGIVTLRALYGGTSGPADAPPSPEELQQKRERAADAKHATPTEALAQQIVAEDKVAAAILAQVVTEASLAEFGERLQGLAEEAQDSAYNTSGDSSEDSPKLSGWVCPVHKVPATRPATSRKGRHYLACAECDEFPR